MLFQVKRKLVRTPLFIGFVFVFVALSSVLLSLEASAVLTIIICILVLVFERTGERNVYFRFVWPLMFIPFLGLPGIFVNEFSHIARDLVYMLWPLAGILIGFWMGGIPKIDGFLMRGVFVSAFILALIHISKFVLMPELLQLESVNEIREIAGTGTGAIVSIAFAVGLTSRANVFHYEFPKWMPKKIALPIFLISIALSFSRSEALLMLLMVVALLGWFTRIKVSGIVGFFVIFLSGLLLITIAPKGDRDSVLGKIAGSIDEITVVDVWDEQSINEKWRAYETYKALESFEMETVVDKVIGQGFGALVDIGIDIQLGGDYIRDIPIFHNGYIYVLIKTGLIGLLCYFVFYFNLIKISLQLSRINSREGEFISRLMMGCTISLIAIMYVIGGIAEIHGAIFLLLIGYMLRRAHQLMNPVKKDGA